jgi:RNA recognition motif-containing protein
MLGHPGQGHAIIAPRRIPSRGKQDNEVSKKLYVGNLSFSSTEEDLKELFGRHGTVESVAVITDRETGRARGFAFVEMAEASAASDAIRALDGSDLGGRNIKVNEAQDRRDGGGGRGGSRY